MDAKLVQLFELLLIQVTDPLVLLHRFLRFGMNELMDKLVDQREIVVLIRAAALAGQNVMTMDFLGGGKFPSGYSAFSPLSREQ